MAGTASGCIVPQEGEGGGLSLPPVAGGGQISESGSGCPSAHLQQANSGPARPSQLPLDSSLLAWVISVFAFSTAHLGHRHLPCTLEPKEFSRPLKPLHGSPVPTGERLDLSRADVPSAVWGPQTSQRLFLALLPSTLLSGQPQPFAAS